MVKPLMPRQPVPGLVVPTVGGDNWRLQDQQPENFTLVVFYRGYHCPICKNYLAELNRLADDFAAKGVSVLALSSDNEERATAVKNEWELPNITIGYDLTLQQAKDWGLYTSAGRGVTSIGVEEPEVFSEPAVYLLRPDGTLYWGNVSTMPFARPHFKELLGALDFVIKNDYPARGELA
ncbi:peroxiredoxin-like family protein [Oceanospirillum sp.]|uniref:peroxiredoxin-like family protein n=1 Tax=Oceanospirillum sp. TaxID=2021254 RepID=UPI003A8C9C9A